MKTCPECGSTKLTWDASCVNNSGVVDGRLRLNEVSGNFILGCDECSETVAIVSAEQVADMLNQMRQQIEAALFPPKEDECICQGFFRPAHCPVHGVGRRG